MLLAGTTGASLGTVSEWPVPYGDGEDDVMWIESDVPVSILEGGEGDDGLAEETDVPVEDNEDLSGGSGSGGGCFVGTARYRE